MISLPDFFLQPIYFAFFTVYQLGNVFFLLAHSARFFSGLEIRIVCLNFTNCIWFSNVTTKLNMLSHLLGFVSWIIYVMAAFYPRLHANLTHQE